MTDTTASIVQVRDRRGIGLILFALAMGGFAIGTSEFAMMA